MTRNEDMKAGADPSLVVGGDSMIGRALITALRADGDVVFATTRRRDAVNEQRLFVDLEAGVWTDLLNRRFKTAYFCAAMARLDACHADPARAMRVNAEQPAALAAALAARGCYVIYLSTNQVFDGAAPCPAHDAPVNPTSVYGRSKAAGEHRVLTIGADAAALSQLSAQPTVVSPGVLRLSKVVEPGMALLANWAERLRLGGAIQAAEDMTLAPLPVSQVVAALRSMALRRSVGVLQLAAGGEITYVDAARHVARRVGVPLDRVEPVAAVAAGFLKEQPPRHTLLNGDRILNELSIHPIDPFDALDTCLGIEFIEKKNP